MSRPAAALALALGALLLSACGSSQPRLQRLPPVEMREILPPPGVATAPQPAPARDALPTVAGAGAVTGPQVAPTAAPDAPPPIAAAPSSSPAAPPASPASAAPGAASSEDFTISLSKGDETSAPPATPAAPGDQASALGDQAAAPVSQAPASVSQAPASVSQAPAPGNQAPAPGTQAPVPDNRAGWPRSYTATGVAFEVHEPQVQSWDGAILVADAAVVVRPDGKRQPVPGVVRMTARTVVDKAAGTVTVEDLTVTDASFPDARDREPAWLALLRSFAPRSVKRLSLSHLEASAREASALAAGDAVAQAEVPRIIVARNPALLVAIDGEPRFVPVPGTKLQGVRNTRVVLLKDAAGKLYLRVYNGWLSATALGGPWAIAQEPPGADQALKAARASGRANLLTGKPDAKTGKLPALTKRNIPLIVVSGQRTVLVGVSGEPKFVPIPGTNLEYVSNTAAHIFRDKKTKRLYVLAGGRWFQGASARGTFDLTPVEKLPADFARIPAGHPKAAAAAFAIPGASPAPALLPPLPTIVAAPRSQARFDVVINGDPSLQPIAGTELNYVANASAPIIQVDINDWYGEQRGVWFKAPEATGPWTVTDHVPPVIYSIPPSVPLYHAIHSRVFASTEDVVYYGYTPGSEHVGQTGGATGVSVEGEDYQTTPPSGMMWGWFY